MKASLSNPTVRIGGKAPFLGASLILLLVLAAGIASADCGSVPFRIYSEVKVVDAPAPPPLAAYGTSNQERPTVLGPADQRGSTVKQLDFDPLKVSVFEPQQRAIILWNGKEEILLLSTDQKATEKSTILEVIPLPSEPKIRLGAFETFEKAQKLVVEKRMWACAHGGAKAGAAALPANAARITFQQKMGAHDLAVANVLDKDAFVEFVQDYLQQKYQTPEAPIRPEFVAIIQSYLDEGCRWFAFDVIELGDSVQSRQPIEYRFASDQVYYPLRISTLEQGETKVDLLVFAPKSIERFTSLPAEKIRREPVVPVTRDEVEGLEGGWRGFYANPNEAGMPFSPASITLNQWIVEGDSPTLTQDVKAR